MIDFESFVLNNGLKVLVHEDHSTSVVVMNILYNVGARDENPDKTGFAHLFEHLMFGGSKNIPTYDTPLQNVGGENNAFTTNDITNYYLTIPSNNVETAFWLESDRMLGLSFDPYVLEVQRNVVIEEFKQRYLNQPYGDAWLKLRPLAYKKHPYQWATIGRNIEQIESATMDDVKNFFYTYYTPSNAIMVLAGDITIDKAKLLSEKWFSSIRSKAEPKKSFIEEPIQQEKRKLLVEAQVPSSVLYKVYHMSGRFSNEYHSQDFISDILGRGKSSPLYQELVIKQKLLSSVNAHVTGSIDPGLLVINAKLNEGIELEQAEHQIDEITYHLESYITDESLQKVKNQAESNLLFSEVELLSRAMNLAYFSLSGDTNSINTEVDKLRKVSTEDIIKEAKTILREKNSSVLYYKPASE